MNMDTIKKDGFYGRKSSEAEDRQVASIPDQLTAFEEMKKRFKVDDDPIVFTEARSAKSPGRSEFNKLVNAIENGEIRRVFCWNLSRLARNGIDGGRIIYAVNELGLEIITPSRVFTKEDIFLMYIEFASANQFINDLSKNVKRGLKSKAEKGWLPSGAKAGYMNDRLADKGNKTILSDPDRFPLIRKAWDCMLTGTYTVMQILRLLNEDWGYRTPKHKRIGGKPMTRSHLYKLFTDPFYYGEFEYPIGSGKWHEGKHEPMILKEEFDRVQRLLGRKGRPAPRSRTFAYTGLLQCGECHANITAEEKFQVICSDCKYKFASQNKDACPKCKTLIEDMRKPTLLHYTYYHCTKRKDPNCSQGSIRLEALDKEFDRTLANIQISERFKDWAIKYLNELSDKETAENVTTLKSLQDAKADCEIRLNNLLKMKISPQNADGSLIDDEDYKKQKELLTIERNSLNNQLEGNDYHSEHWRETAEKSFDFACHARYWFANGNTQTRREILAGMGSNLMLINKTVRVDLEKPLQFIETALIEEPSISVMFEPEEKADNTLQIERQWANNSILLLD